MLDYEPLGTTPHSHSSAAFVPVQFVASGDVGSGRVGWIYGSSADWTSPAVQVAAPCLARTRRSHANTAAGRTPRRSGAGMAGVSVLEMVPSVMDLVAVKYARSDCPCQMTAP